MKCYFVLQWEHKVKMNVDDKIPFDMTIEIKMYVSVQKSTAVPFLKATPTGMKK